MVVCSSPMTVPPLPGAIGFRAGETRCPAPTLSIVVVVTSTPPGPLSTPSAQEGKGQTYLPPLCWRLPAAQRAAGARAGTPRATGETDVTGDCESGEKPDGGLSPLAGCGPRGKQLLGIPFPPSAFGRPSGSGACHRR